VRGEAHERDIRQVAIDLNQENVHCWGQIPTAAGEASSGRGV